MSDGTPQQEAEILLFCQDKKWSSRNSIAMQQITKLSKSDSNFPVPSKMGSNASFEELELNVISIQDNTSIQRKFQSPGSRSRFPRLMQTKSLLRDELEILKINMSVYEKGAEVSESSDNVKRRNKREKRLLAMLCLEPEFWKFCTRRKASDLMTELEGSESIKTDTTMWKFLKRGSTARKQLLYERKCFLELQNWLSLDFHIRNCEPLRLTCPNCTFFITTRTKRVTTIKTKLLALIFLFIGMCITTSHVFHFFKDTVHICPLCRIYLGFCPAVELNVKNSDESKCSTKVKETSIKGTMVSASSTSAKNLFVESKLRLADKVQVNVNNIAAIARQIQRGSKASENLMAAAKSFALQEAAIQNSESNLKELQLLTENLNTQVESIQNSSAKMELVLEQVRSMQR